MAKLFLLFSHKLTDDQIADAKKSLNISDFLYLPVRLQDIWSNVTPYGEFDVKALSKITEWLLDNADKDDYILVQGDFGATFYLVDFCFKNNLVPVYSTTKRESKEVKSQDGRIEKTLYFKHINYRKYRRCEDE